jgi:hypothetical protein
MTVSFFQIVVFFALMFLLFGDFKKAFKRLAFIKISLEAFLKKLKQNHKK